MWQSTSKPRLDHAQSLPAGCTSGIKRQKGREGKSNSVYIGRLGREVPGKWSCYSFPFFHTMTEIETNSHANSAVTAMPATPSCLSGNHIKRSTMRWATMRCCQSTPSSWREMRGQQSGQIRSSGQGVPEFSPLVSVEPDIACISSFQEINLEAKTQELVLRKDYMWIL